VTRDGPRLVASQIRVTDLSRTVRSLRALGLRTVATWTMADGERLAWLRDPLTGQMVELYWVPRRSRFYEPYGRPRRFDTPLLFALRDATPVLARLRRRGAAVPVDFEEGDVRITFVREPGGVLFELVSWSRAAKPRPAGPPLRRLGRAARRRPR